VRLLLLTVCCLPFLALSQTFENVRATSLGNKVAITYDLVAPQNDQPYAVEIYGSHNNYTSPIRLLTGDVGNNVLPGRSKRAEWDVLSELKTFKGDITFEVRGRPVVVKLNFKSPTAGGSVRRGKSTSVQWFGGTPQQQVKLELLKNGQVVSSLGERTNTGSYEWVVPKDMEKGDGFSLKLTSGQETVNSGTFSVKSKVPLALKIAPVLVAGGVVAVLMSGKDDPDTPGGGGTTNENLPGAPDPN
jgi:hypothetical protein